MQKQEPKIYFHFTDGNAYLPQRRQLKAFINQIFKTEQVLAERIDFIFCSDAYLLSLNTTYLKHNTYTDIITFRLSDPNAEIISDIYISTERVKENASNLSVSFKAELHRVIFHGVLHLCDYKDKTKHQKQEMRKKENFYLEQYLVSRETI